MVNPDVLGYGTALTVGAPLALAYGTTAVRYAMVDVERRAAMRKAWQIRRSWRRTAARVGLVQTDHAAKVGADIPLPAELRHAGEKPKVLVPRIKVHVQQWGLRIEVETLGRLGLGEFQAAADYLADAWRVPLVRVEKSRPGYIRIRALLRDPLTVTTTYTPDPSLAVDLTSWHVGHDQDNEPVTVRSSGVSGMVIAGLSGYGKTSLINTRISKLAPSPAVQFAMIDGKGGPDYDDLFCRAWLAAKDDVADVNAKVAKIHRLLLLRQSGIKQILGTKNAWSVGPSEKWPLILVIIDEAHTFLNETKTDRERDKITADTARMIEELIRKGRNVMIQVLLATQKATGDAIPTKIRDNCQLAISFAQRTSEATVAALGSDISDYPEAHPRRLQHPDYIGVASMVTEGRPGFTLVRTPYTADDDAAQIADATKDLVIDPLALIEYQLQGLHSVSDGSDLAAA